MKTYLPIVCGNKLIRRGIVLLARHCLGYSVEHVTLTMSVNSRNNVVLVTLLRTSLDLVMSDIHFAKQIIVEKIPSAVTLDH